MPISPLPRHEPSVSFSQENLDTVSLLRIPWLSLNKVTIPPLSQSQLSHSDEGLD